MKDVLALPPSGFPHWLRNNRIGEILYDLAICENHAADTRINRVVLRTKQMVASQQRRVLPNFRQGDAVVLYERNTDTDNVTNKMVFKGNIECISDDRFVSVFVPPSRMRVYCLLLASMLHRARLCGHLLS